MQRAGPGHVRFGSLADILGDLRHVRFTPKADIVECDRHVRFVPIADITESCHIQLLYVIWPAAKDHSS
jgi:hypothetical protein